MVEPKLKWFDMLVLFEAPMARKDVPLLDDVITHGDNDHYRIPNLKELAPNMAKAIVDVSGMLGA